MRAGIRLKLFVTLLAALCILVLAMVMLMQWSLDRGFRRYVTTIEEERLERLADDLAEGFFDNLLDRAAFSLALPADIGGAVVFNGQADSSHSGGG